MQIGVALPSHLGLPDPLELVDMAVQAEELGFDVVWLGEHVFNSGYIRDRLGDLPYHAPLPLLAFIAARTSRIRLGTSVLVLPNHHPATLAKFLVNLDQLSGGRVIAGVGCGGNKPEFEEMGLDFAARGRITNEMLEVMHALFTQPRASHHGEYWNFDDVIFAPKPVQDPFPIWVGGMFDSAPSLRRTALYGTGWQPAGLSPVELAEAAGRIRAMAAEAGRDPALIQVSACLAVDYGEPLSFEAERKTLISSKDPQKMAQELRVWRDHGADDVMLRLNTPDIALIRSELDRIGRDVLPLMRE